MAKRIRVAVFGAHPAILAGLHATLTRSPQLLSMVLRKSSEAGRPIQTSSADVVLSHLEFMRGGRWELDVDQLNLPVVVATEVDKISGSGLVQLLRRGAIGLVCIATDLAALTTACSGAARSRPYVSPSLVGKLVEFYRGSESQSTASEFGLTAREVQVLRCLGEGAAHQTIADTLGMEKRTLRHHLEQIYRKLKVTGRHEAVAVAYREGLVG